ncbi:fibronectin type III domain-containing protein [Candidatus Woesearchaeota archaeon]|nr:fibronectin type III domain-containing protein [Candidatus Woesearchaeota archaeon]
MISERIRRLFGTSILMVALLLLLVNIVAADIPSGYITIYGPNGTTVTGTRNVLLNLSYSSSDGIDFCRWANDVASNLDSALWEPCTTVKAWILSEGYGNKTVFFGLRDLAGHTSSFNDSIEYRFVQDYTKPLPPIVIDGRGTEDIDWWNSNTTLAASWRNATEDISTLYYKYRVLENGSCFGSCVWIDANTATSVDITGIALDEGNNYSFEVMAYNPSGFNSSVTSSDGVFIDLTRPGAPNVTSTSHPSQSLPYDISYALFNFSADDILSAGMMSGIDGYSYILDSVPGTSPDNYIDTRGWERLERLRKGNDNQTLKNNGTGLAYSVFSQLHFNISVNDTVLVRVALAEQFSDYSDLSGVRVYLARNTGGTLVSLFNLTGSAVSNIYSEEFDVRYAETMGLARIYSFELVVNESLNEDVDDLYVVVAAMTDDDDNRNPLAIARTATDVDNTTRCFVCDESNSCVENTTSLDYSIEVKRRSARNDWTAVYDLLADGIYYFHVKAKDMAGNWGDPNHYRIIVAAGGVESMVVSPLNGEVFITDGFEKNITVLVSVSSNATVRVVAEHADGSSSVSLPQVFEGTASFENITVELGQDEIYALTNNSNGAMARSPGVFITVAPGEQPFMNKTLRVRYPGCSATALPYICNADETTSYVGLATEDLGSISEPSLQADTSLNTIKLYMTRPFDTGSVASELAENTFLDVVNPMFGFERGISSYLLRTELRYLDIRLDGDFRVSPGVHKLYIRKGGHTLFGAQNITLSIE